MTRTWTSTSTRTAAWACCGSARRSPLPARRRSLHWRGCSAPACPRAACCSSSSTRTATSARSSPATGRAEPWTTSSSAPAPSRSSASWTRAGAGSPPAATSRCATSACSWRSSCPVTARRCPGPSSSRTATGPSRSRTSAASWPRPCGPPCSRPGPCGRRRCSSGRGGCSTTTRTATRNRTSPPTTRPCPCASRSSTRTRASATGATTCRWARTTSAAPRPRPSRPRSTRCRPTRCSAASGA